MAIDKVAVHADLLKRQNATLQTQALQWQQRALAAEARIAEAKAFMEAAEARAEVAEVRAEAVETMREDSIETVKEIADKNLALEIRMEVIEKRAEHLVDLQRKIVVRARRAERDYDRLRMAVEDLLGCVPEANPLADGLSLAGEEMTMEGEDFRSGNHLTDYNKRIAKLRELLAEAASEEAP
jgi:hypothetical protein